MICPVCNKPIGHADTRLYVFEKARAHLECIDRVRKERGKEGLFRLADSLPCCESRSILRLFRGCVVMEEKDIPADEIWYIRQVAEDRAAKLVRLKVHDDGRVTRLASASARQAGG